MADTMVELAKVVDEMCGKRVASVLDDAAGNVSVHLAFVNGWTSEHELYDPDPFPSDDDLIRALRTSWPIASVLAAVAERFGVAVPPLVARAMEDVAPLPPAA